MEKDRFWALVEWIRCKHPGDPDSMCEEFGQALKAMDGRVCKAVAEVFDHAMIQSYSWRLWGAAYIIGGGCSDDAFADFRSSLVFQGRKVFELALSDPDSLARVDLDDQDVWFFEGFQYAVSNAVAEVCGDAVNRLRARPPSEPAGVEWNEESLPQLLPKLAAKYLS